MDRIRSAFNHMIRSERYSRFTLQPREDGERHAEVKLSDDAAEADVEGSPTFRPAPRQSRRNLLYLILGTLLIFLIGFFIGYASQRKPQVELVNCPAAETQEPPAQDDEAPIAPEVKMTWETLSRLFNERLSTTAFDDTLKAIEVPSRVAGSVEDTKLGNDIFETFKALQMDPWTDVHYVQLPTPDSEHPNFVEFDSKVFNPKGYLAYSAVGRVTGKLVYGNYGRKEDLDAVATKDVVLKDSVLLLRAGKISFAEQVNNAESVAAAAVLIYPDSKDYSYRTDTPLYGHVHLGSGDPFTPGFPSFNHTQFPPTRSSGLPKIPAQTIDGNTASALFGKIGGPASDAGFKGNLDLATYQLGGMENVTVEVNNVQVNTKIHNVFGVVKGFVDPDEYVVLGAQRDAWGPGYAKATVGSSVLIELAKAFQMMVKKGFTPRRSLVFASWSAGEFGSVGATEWLEAHMSSIGKNVITYISLDAVVMGRGSFIASASPLLYSLLESTMKEVKSPLGPGTVSDMVVGEKWETAVMRPMTIDDPAYPFLASFGIPSISFHFISPNSESYTYFGTKLDSMDHLRYETSHSISEMMMPAAQLAGRMALRLVHDHLLNFDVSRYRNLLFKSVRQVNKRVAELSQSGQLKNVSILWLSRAQGSFVRAANRLQNERLNTDLDDEACRLLNNRLMMIENNLISPYVSPVATPFRHLLFGRGNHTLESIATTDDMKELHTQLALATWNLQGCANAMVANIWDIDNEI